MVSKPKTASLASFGWLVAGPVVAVLLSVFLLLFEARLNTRLCPSSALVCWSTGQTADLGPLVAFATAFAAVLWLRFAKALTRSIKLFVVAATTAAVVLTGYGTYVDGDRYDAISIEGLLVKERGMAPTLHPWSDIVTVRAWCETGSRSGPYLMVDFGTRAGRILSYDYQRWVRLSRAHPSLLESTDAIPYSTSNLDFCRRKYSYLPVSSLNAAPLWFPAKPAGPILGILLVMAAIPSILILSGMFFVMRQQELRTRLPPRGDGAGI